MGISTSIITGIGYSLSKQTLVNIFDYDTATIATDGRGTIDKVGDGVIEYTVVTVGTTANGGIINGLLEAGKTYRVLFKAKSDTMNGGIHSLGDIANTVVANKTQNLTAEYQTHDFTITPTQTTLRMYFQSAGAIIGSVLSYKDIVIYEL